MPKQEEKQLVAYTKDQMFDLVSNIDEYKEFLPWCNDSKIISRERFDDYEVVTADLEIGYDQFVYTYRSEVKLAKDKSFRIFFTLFLNSMSCFFMKYFFCSFKCIFLINFRTNAKKYTSNRCS